MRRRALMALAVCGLLAGAGAASEQDANASMQADQLVERVVLPDIPVTDARGQRRGFLSRYANAGPLLVSFMYTNCTEYCGLTISVMGLIDMELQGADAPPLRLVLITVDPARDTPQVLAEMSGQMQSSARWDWLVASPEDTPVLLSAFGMGSGPIEQHPVTYFLGDLQTGLFRRLPADTQPDQVLALARQLP